MSWTNLPTEALFACCMLTLCFAVEQNQLAAATNESATTARAMTAPGAFQTTHFPASSSSPNADVVANTTLHRTSTVSATTRSSFTTLLFPEFPESNNSFVVIVIVVVICMVLAAGSFVTFCIIFKQKKNRKSNRKQTNTSIRSVASGVYETIGPALPDRPSNSDNMRQQVVCDGEQQSDSGYVEANRVRVPVRGKQNLSKHVKPLEEDEHGYMRSTPKHAVAQFGEGGRDAGFKSENNRASIPRDENGYLKINEIPVKLAEDAEGYLQVTVVQT